MICEICENEFHGGNWSDFHGEQECMYCGNPIQVKDYHGAPEDEVYPHTKLNKDFIPIFKEYWNTFHRRCRLGTYMGTPPEVREQLKHFTKWLKEIHPEWLSS